MSWARENRKESSEMFDDSALSNIEQMLSEEDMEEMSKMLHDPGDLQSMENSFYQALWQKPPLASECVSNTESVHHCPNDDISELVGPSRLNTLSVGDISLLFWKGVEEATQLFPQEFLLSTNDKPHISKASNNDAPQVELEVAVHEEETRRLQHLAAPGSVDDEMLMIFDTLSVSCVRDGVSPKHSRKRLDHKRNQLRDRALESSQTPGPENKLLLAVDLGSLCAEALSAGRSGAADRLLQEIRKHATAFGDGFQRSAHYFANGLEGRLMGLQHTTSDSDLPSDGDLLKAYEAFNASTPFRRVSLYLMMHNILNVAEKAKTLHIIDFSIILGFRWAMVIQQLSARPGGAPKIRITAVEDPQPDFQPSELLEKMGHLLAKYCERMNVPFEYNRLAKKCETVQVEELKIDRDEVIIVSCSLQFEKLLDEHVLGVNCPRSTVFELIRLINPALFFHSIVNGSYNVPVFSTRFRRCVNHYSAFYDMLDALFCRDDEQRYFIEKYFLGQNVFNAVACEGSQMIERPETYKQWGRRTRRAGFVQIPLNKKLMKSMRELVKSEYHKDFLIEQDDNWVLQGWKGQTLFASCCWKPAP